MFVRNVGIFSCKSLQPRRPTQTIVFVVCNPEMAGVQNAIRVTSPRSAHCNVVALKRELRNVSLSHAKVVKTWGWIFYICTNDWKNKNLVVQYFVWKTCIRNPLVDCNVGNFKQIRKCTHLRKNDGVFARIWPVTFKHSHFGAGRHVDIYKKYTEFLQKHLQREGNTWIGKLLEKCHFLCFLWECHNRPWWKSPEDYEIFFAFCFPPLTKPLNNRGCGRNFVFCLCTVGAVQTPVLMELNMGIVHGHFEWKLNHQKTMISILYICFLACVMSELWNCIRRAH